MALDIDALRTHKFEQLTQTYTDKDTLLYAVSLGFGQDPLNANQLKFAYEGDLHGLPTMPAILCHPGSWSNDPRFKITRSKVVHGAQAVFLHAPVPPAASLIADARVEAVEDKGEKGALFHVVRTMREAQSGREIASVLHSTFCRADGGFGGGFGTAPTPHKLPEREPDFIVDISTRPEAALLYRLNIDRNPLHADPAYAQKAGFPVPILHGLCTYGLAGRALLESMLDYDSDQLRSIECRFSAPVYPGETITFELWRDDNIASFRAVVRARSVKVLDAGKALIGSDVELPSYAR